MLFQQYQHALHRKLAQKDPLMGIYPHLNHPCDPPMNLTANQPLDSLIIHYHINMQMYTGFCVVHDRVAK